MKMLRTKKKVRSNNVQLNMLVDYMITHKVFANGEFTGPLGNQRMPRQWDEVRTILSEHGPDKSVDQWKHTWRDLKKRSREEGARIRQAREKTGDASFVPTISEIGSKVLSVIGKECAFGIGDPGETGIGSFMSQPRPATIAESDVCSTNVLLPHCTVTDAYCNEEVSLPNSEIVYAEVSQPQQQLHIVQAPTPSQPHMVSTPTTPQSHTVSNPTPSQRHHMVSTSTISQSNTVSNSMPSQRHHTPLHHSSAELVLVVGLMSFWRPNKRAIKF